MKSDEKDPFILISFIFKFSENHNFAVPGCVLKMQENILIRAQEAQRIVMRGPSNILTYIYT